MNVCVSMALSLSPHTVYIKTCIEFSTADPQSDGIARTGASRGSVEGALLGMQKVPGFVPARQHLQLEGIS